MSDALSRNSKHSKEKRLMTLLPMSPLLVTSVRFGYVTMKGLIAIRKIPAQLGMFTQQLNRAPCVSGAPGLAHMQAVFCVG